MKRSLLMMTASVFIFSACSGDEATTYEQSEFYGIWELRYSTSESYKECPANTPDLAIGEDVLIFAITDDQGCTVDHYGTNYIFHENQFTITAYGISEIYTITSYSQTEFTWENYFQGNQETYVKVD